MGTDEIKIPAAVTQHRLLLTRVLLLVGGLIVAMIIGYVIWLFVVPSDTPAEVTDVTRVDTTMSDTTVVEEMEVVSEAEMEEVVQALINNTVAEPVSAEDMAQQLQELQKIQLRKQLQADAAEAERIIQLNNI